MILHSYASCVPWSGYCRLGHVHDHDQLLNVSKSHDPHKSLDI